MKADTPPETPWVLIRKRRPPARFPTLIKAQKFYDQLRFNAGAQEDAAVFGPGGEAWYCRSNRAASWVRNDRRRAEDDEDDPEIAP